MALTQHFSPDIFTLVPMSALSKAHFDRHPIWSEHYDFDEREEIAQWGVDPTWLTSELERFQDGDDHCVYPILQPYPLPVRMRLFIKTRLNTADGIALDGYIMNEDAYVMSVFTNEDEFIFSRNSLLIDDNHEELDRLLTALETPGASVFPVRYETDILDSKGRLIKGDFTLPAGR